MTAVNNRPHAGVKVVSDSASRTFPNGFSGNVKGILLKAPGVDDDTPNTASVFIGFSSNVTADQTGSGGFPLAPGESITIPVEDASNIWDVATDTNQKLNWIAL